MNISVFIQIAALRHYQCRKCHFNHIHLISEAEAEKIVYEKLVRIHQFYEKATEK